MAAARVRVGALGAGLLGSYFALATPAALAAGAPVNTVISNTATATYNDPSGTPQVVTSNPATVTVDEILNVIVVANDGGRVAATTPATDVVLSFTVTNTGNGTEAFELTVAQVGGDPFDPQAVEIRLDNGDGVFDGDEVAYVFGANDPVLAPDAGVIAYLVSDIPAGLSNGDVGDLTLRATAVTAGPAGDPAGTTFGGQGDGGTDAVAGSSTASVTTTNGYLVSSVTSTLTKAQVVTDPFGGNAAVPGSTITYTLTFTLSGSGSVTLGQITDSIPANATYVAGSLTLDAAPLTDASGDDAGRFTGTGIEVTLPSPLAAPASHTVTFQVTVN